MAIQPPEEDLDAELSGNMSFLDHLEELRTRLFRVLIAIGVTFVVCWAFVEDIYRIVAFPIMDALQGRPMVFINPTQPFSLFMKLAFLAAVFLASPFIMAQVWLFIAPGLYKQERRYAIPFILSSSILAVLGGLFGYFIAFRYALQFLISWGERAGLEAMIDATQYFNLFITIELGLAIIFQIPPIIFVLSRFGLVSGWFLLRNTKYSILIAFVVAAIITPTADIPNMMIMAIPMIVLYMIGVLVAFVFGSREAKL